MPNIDQTIQATYKKKIKTLEIRGNQLINYGLRNGFDDDWNRGEEVI